MSSRDGSVSTLITNWRKKKQHRKETENQHHDVWLHESTREKSSRRVQLGSGWLSRNRQTRRQKSLCHCQQSQIGKRAYEIGGATEPKNDGGTIKRYPTSRCVWCCTRTEICLSLRSRIFSWLYHDNVLHNHWLTQSCLHTEWNAVDNNYYWCTLSLQLCERGRPH